MMDQRETRDWATVMERLIGGDAAAFDEASGLVSRLLHSWRAHYLRSEWEDLTQEVLTTVARDFECDHIRNRRALAGYIRTVTRRRLVDLLRQRRPWLVPLDPDRIACRPSPLCWDGLGLPEHVRRLPARQRLAIEAVYFEGLTQEEAATHSGIPLGSLKRDLRKGLAALRVALGAALN